MLTGQGGHATTKRSSLGEPKEVRVRGVNGGICISTPRYTCIHCILTGSLPRADQSCDGWEGLVLEGCARNRGGFVAPHAARAERYSTQGDETFR